MQPPYLYFTTLWIDHLAKTGRPDVMALLLDKLNQASRVPAEALEKALIYIIRHRDEDLLKKVLVLHSKMGYLSVEKKERVDELISRIPAEIRLRLLKR